MSVGSTSHTQVCVLEVIVHWLLLFSLYFSALFCFAVCIGLVFVMRSDLALVVASFS